MKVPVSWLKDFVEIDLPLEDLAHRLTMAGLEVEDILYVGLPMGTANPELHGSAGIRDTKVAGISWDPDKIVVAEILEVLPHPNADRLVLADEPWVVEDLKELAAAEEIALTFRPMRWRSTFCRCLVWESDKIDKLLKLLPPR